MVSIEKNKVRRLTEEQIKVAFKRLDYNKSYFFDPQKGLFVRENDANLLISNAVFIPMQVYKNIYVDEEKTEISVELAIILASEKPENSQGFEIEIPLEKMEKIDFQKEVDTRICTSYCVEHTNRIIARIIKQAIVAIPCRERFVLARLGWCEIKGRHVYCAGDVIIGNTDGLQIYCTEELQNYKFEKEENSIYEKDNMEKLLDLYLSLYEGKSPLVFAYFVLSLIKKLLRAAHIPIKFSMFLCGENQSYKTTIASYGTALYYRKTDVETKIHNLSGTEAQLHRVLHLEKDMVSLIDDLNLCDSKATMREQEKKISSIIFAAANNVGRETMKYSNSINSLVMFCGEYCLTNPSTNNRLIVIKLEKEKISKNTLLEFEKKSAFLANFAFDFISWCAENFNEIVNLLGMEFEKFRISRGEKGCYQERLQEHYKLLSMAYMIFLQFCEQKKIKIHLAQKEFDLFLEQAMYEQIDLLELEERDEEDYVMQLFCVLSDRWDELVSSKSIKKKGCWHKKVYFDKEKEILCIPSGVLEEIAQGDIRNAVTAYEIASQFQKLDLLIIDNNRNHSRTKKVKGKRAYCVDYCKWKHYVEETYGGDNENSSEDEDYYD